MNATPYPWNIQDKAKRFDALNAASWLDLEWSGNNQRACRCGRCNKRLAKGEGRGYNEFMTDGYRCTIKYLCNDCLALATQPNIKNTQERG